MPSVTESFLDLLDPMFFTDSQSERDVDVNNINHGNKQDSINAFNDPALEISVLVKDATEPSLNDQECSPFSPDSSKHSSNESDCVDADLNDDSFGRYIRDDFGAVVDQSLKDCYPDNNYAPPIHVASGNNPTPSDPVGTRKEPPNPPFNMDKNQQLNEPTNPEKKRKSTASSGSRKKRKNQLLFVDETPKQCSSSNPKPLVNDRKVSQNGRNQRLKNSTCHNTQIVHNTLSFDNEQDNRLNPVKERNKTISSNTKNEIKIIDETTKQTPPCDVETITETLYDHENNPPKIHEQFYIQTPSQMNIDLEFFWGTSEKSKPQSMGMFTLEFPSKGKYNGTIVKEKMKEAYKKDNPVLYFIKIGPRLFHLCSKRKGYPSKMRFDGDKNVTFYLAPKHGKKRQGHFTPSCKNFNITRTQHR